MLSYAILLTLVSAVAVSGQAAPVAVALYMESLCPGCQAFFAGQLFPTWQKLNATGIMTVDVIPYGNAQEEQQGDKWIFTCQHGPDECVGNQLETCAINLLQSPLKWMPYLHCIELKLSSGGQDVPTVAKDCANQFNISFDPISQCALSAQGNAWQHANAQRTEALNPPHQYVPWVTVNGVHTDKIQSDAEKNLLKLVCSTYTGTTPNECGKLVVERCARK